MVLLYIVIGPEGKLVDVAVYKPLSPDLDEEALKAVRKWRFKPGTKNGVPVTVSAQIEINFRLLD